MTRFAGTETNAPFVLEGTYFGRQRFEGVEERDGLRMHFAGWSQPLEATRLRWREQDSQSRPFANQFPKPAMDGITCNAGPKSHCFSG
jgi:hypothetical protein